MFEAGRFGQKNGKGFYAYIPDKKGTPKKTNDPEVQPLVSALARIDNSKISDQDIIDRMMLPMIIESRTRARGGTSEHDPTLTHA